MRFGADGMHGGVEQLLVMGATVGSGIGLFAQQLVEDGASPSLAVQGVLLGFGVALFMFFDRRERASIKERNLERREADEAKDRELDQLRTEVRELHERIIRILRGEHDAGA